MDKAQKERLLGATILVVIVVLVVPALLTGPRDGRDEEPSPATGLRTVEIEIGEAASEAEAQPTDPAVESEIAPATETAPLGTEPSPATAPPPRQDTVAERTPQATSPPAAQREQEPGRAVSPPVPEGSGFAVQVAALSKPEAARELADALKAQGYRAFVMEYRADGKLFYRVRVGPEPSREKADVLARRLAGEGHKAVVVRHP